MAVFSQIEIKYEPQTNFSDKKKHTLDAYVRLGYLKVRLAPTGMIIPSSRVKPLQMKYTCKIRDNCALL